MPSAGVEAGRYFENSARPTLKQGGPLVYMLETGGLNLAILLELLLLKFFLFFSEQFDMSFARLFSVVSE